MNRLPNQLLLIILLTYAWIGITHAQSVRNQTLSAMGSQSLSLSSGLRVQQSIGQSSVTGTFNTNSTYLSQGFLRGRIAPSKEIFIPFSDPRVAENTWRPFLCLDTETDFNTKCIRMSSGIECTQTCMRSWLFISSKCPCSPISATGELVCCPSNLLA